MSVNAGELLRALGGGIRPVGLGDGATPGTTRAGAPGSLAFADLLAKARAGAVSSNLPVTVAKGAGVNLSDDQLRRLAVAADRAEAAGLTRALVLIDGKALRLDVGVRQITGTVELAPGAALSGIDGVVQAPGAEDSSPAMVPISPANPSRVRGLNASLVRALAQGSGQPPGVNQ